MTEALTNALSSFEADLISVAGAALPVAAAALLVWMGFRLSAKLGNRGVGK